MTTMRERKRRFLARDTQRAWWEAEINRRLDEWRRGEVQAIDADEVFARVRRLVNLTSSERSPQPPPDALP